MGVVCARLKVPWMILQVLICCNHMDRRLDKFDSIEGVNKYEAVQRAYLKLLRQHDADEIEGDGNVEDHYDASTVDLVEALSDEDYGMVQLSCLVDDERLYITGLYLPCLAAAAVILNMAMAWTQVTTLRTM